MANTLILNEQNNSLTITSGTPTTNAISVPDTCKITGVFPIGSIYCTVSDIYPGDYFGGYWEKEAWGRVLIGVDPDDADFNSSDIWGGSDTQTLEIENLPEHDHAIRRVVTGGKTGTAITRPRARTNTDLSWGLTTESIGGSLAHENKMPYISCHIWRRIN